MSNITKEKEQASDEEKSEPGMSSNVLITGISGFVGSHLAEYLLNEVDEKLTVYGLLRSGENPTNLAGLQGRAQLVLQPLALQDTAALSDWLKEIRPAYIFHLAAQSLPSRSFHDPAETLTTNTTLALSLFEAMRQAGLGSQTRLLNAGSGEVYGFIRPDDLPVTESVAFRPGNPYAVSKVTQEMLGYQYFRGYGLHIVNTRAFNHIGSRQSPELAASAFARQIAQAEAGQIEPVIRVGNLEARRDFTSVQDIVRAYWLALRADKPGCQPGEAYNLCSGQDYSIRQILNALLEMAKLRLEVQTDPARLRPSDIPVIRGDYSKFQRATDWQPRVPLSDSLNELLNYWRQTVRQS